MPASDFLQPKTVEIDLENGFGESQHYSQGTICIWRGNEPCIFRVARSAGKCFVATARDYNSLHYSNVRIATEKEEELLGDQPIFHINKTNLIIKNNEIPKKNPTRQRIQGQRFSKRKIKIKSGSRPIGMQTTTGRSRTKIKRSEISGRRLFFDGDRGNDGSN